MKSSKVIMKHLSSESIIAIVVIALVLIPLVSFSMFSFYQVSQSLTNIIKQDIEAKSILVASDIDNFITERIIDARVVSQADVFEGDNVTAKSQYLTEVVAENKWINDIDVIDKTGIIIASSGTQNETGKLFWERYPIDRSLFLSVTRARQGQVYVSEAIPLDTGSGILFITPITDDSNTQVISVLAIEVNLDSIANAVSLFSQGIIGEKYVYIVDNAGRVIVSDDPTAKFHGRFPDLQNNPKLLNAFSEQGRMGNIIYTDHSGDEVMTGYADMAEFGENKALDWGLIAIAPMDEITAPVTRLKQQLLVIAGLIALLSVFLAYRAITAINKRLGNLATQADAISQGDFSVQKLKETHRSGAFNTLVVAINRMKVSIHQLIGELEDREQRLNITLNSIGDGVIATDEKGYVTRMNPIAEKLTGWALEEAEGVSLKKVFPIIDESSRKPIANPVDKVLATGETVYLCNHTTLLSKDGSEYLIEDSAAPIRSEDHSIHGMILIFSDVTRRKQAELRYRQSLKMDALGKLTGGIAHDYNNMLGVIMGYCELLNDDAKDQPKILKHVDIILKSAQRGAALTRKLLDFSRQRPSEIVTLNIATLLQKQRMMLQKTLTARIDLTFDLAEDLWAVQLDESDLIDAVLNICINAMHAIEETGRITIRVSNVSLNQADADSLDIPPGDYVLLCITDTGCGMTESTKNKIYDPFFTTKGSKGTGLGLSQVYGFVQRSKGAIKVYSELGHGTRLALYFPRYNQEGNIKPDEKNIIENVFGNETILVVDDEPNLLQFCSAALKKHGFNIFTAENAQAALDILEHESVDLLFSDIIMPRMTGYQLASIVSEKYPNIKIQLASGFADERESDSVNDDLKNNLLIKPYNTQALLQAINKLLKRK